MDTWEQVQGRLITSMLILGHTWPLAEALDNHPLVTFINYQHKTKRELMLLHNPAMLFGPSQEEVLQASDSNTASHGTERLGEENIGALPEELRCTRCEKPITGVSDLTASQGKLGDTLSSSSYGAQWWSAVFLFISGFESEVSLRGAVPAVSGHSTVHGQRACVCSRALQAWQVVACKPSE